MYGQKGKCKGTDGKISIFPSEKYGMDVFIVKNLLLVITINRVS